MYTSFDLQGLLYFKLRRAFLTDLKKEALLLDETKM